MNKIAQYLNEHILGEVHYSESVCQAFSHDGSILSIKPEIVIHPRTTNDIRKIARFSWQLAEKGHVLPITVRGGGSNKSGAAIGKGVIVNTIAHLNKTIFISLNNKDQFIHVQPGITFGNLNEILKSHDMYIPTFPSSAEYSTIGGSVADNSGGRNSGQYGLTGDWVTRTELILSNGDLIETSRISKHELNKKKGLQTFEGEIYRKIDGIIEDNQQIIDDKITNNSTDNTGYTGISKVKNRDGSFDLTPLIIGNQGTLGIMSEIVLRTTPYNSDESIIVAIFNDPEIARDAADLLMEIQPSVLDYFDSELYNMALRQGKKYIFTDLFDNKSGTVVFASFNNISDRIQKRKMKQALKKLSKLETTIFTNSDYSNNDLYAIAEVGSVIIEPINKDESRPSIIDGVSVPADRREDFIVAVDELAKKHHIKLPLHIRWMDNVINTRPTLQLNNISERQKTFKLINDYVELVTRFGGSTSADGTEGRLRSIAAYSQLDDDVLDIYNQIKNTFDPFGILNPGVKQKSDLKTLVANLEPNYNLANFAKYSPKE